jgi:hypothetical protein
LNHHPPRQPELICAFYSAAEKKLIRTGMRLWPPPFVP